MLSILLSKFFKVKDISYIHSGSVCDQNEDIINPMQFLTFDIVRLGLMIIHYIDILSFEVWAATWENGFLAYAKTKTLNKDADQLRGHRKADQRLCFRHLDSTISLLTKSEISSL